MVVHADNYCVCDLGTYKLTLISQKRPLDYDDFEIDTPKHVDCSTFAEWNPICKKNKEEFRKYSKRSGIHN